jgi:hypothetical protein
MVMVTGLHYPLLLFRTLVSCTGWVGSWCSSRRIPKTGERQEAALAKVVVVTPRGRISVLQLTT